MPLLIALGAHVVLMSGAAIATCRWRICTPATARPCWRPTRCWRGSRCRGPQPAEFLRAYKISKRYDDDISAVCLVSTWAGRRQGRDRSDRRRRRRAPRRCAPANRSRTAGPALDRRTRRSSRALLRAEFQPISDMRAWPATAARCWAICCSASGWRARAWSALTWKLSTAGRRRHERATNHAPADRARRTRTWPGTAPHVMTRRRVSRRTKAPGRRWPAPPPMSTTSPRSRAPCTPRPSCPLWRMAACSTWTPARHWRCPACTAWCWRRTFRATRCWRLSRTTSRCSRGQGRHMGQVIGVVVADTVMQARRAARKVQAGYRAAAAVLSLREAHAEAKATCCRR